MLDVDVRGFANGHFGIACTSLIFLISMSVQTANYTSKDDWAQPRNMNVSGAKR